MPGKHIVAEEHVTCTQDGKQNDIDDVLLVIVADRLVVSETDSVDDGRIYYETCQKISSNRTDYDTVNTADINEHNGNTQVDYYAYKRSVPHLPECAGNGSYLLKFCLRPLISISAPINIGNG